MKIKFTPSVARGVIQAPPSKSVSHRALIAGSLSEESILHGISLSDDISATLSCLKTLGAKAEFHGDKLIIGGLDAKNIPSCTIDCGESGSTLRFLIPVCLLSGSAVTFRGHGRLLQRPLGEYETLCREKGFDFILNDDSLTVCGKLEGGNYEISAEKSSQFVTGMMYALSLCENESILRVPGNAESKSYIRLTADVIREFGIGIHEDDLTFTITGKDKFSSREYTVEGDYSNAAFPDALNLLGGEVTVTGLKESSVQGDKVYKDLYDKLISRGITDLSDCPDLAPILFALAGIYGGHFTGCRRLRLKESDRINSMKEELEKCGIMLYDDDDEVIIPKGNLHAPGEIISGHNDHRIVMAMSVLLSKTGGMIEGAQAVSKSWPEFFDEIKKLGINVQKVL